MGGLPYPQAVLRGVVAVRLCGDMPLPTPNCFWVGSVLIPTSYTDKNASDQLYNGNFRQSLQTKSASPNFIERSASD
jgi:hypothetical protein